MDAVRESLFDGLLLQAVALVERGMMGLFVGGRGDGVLASLMGELGIWVHTRMWVSASFQPWQYLDACSAYDCGGEAPLQAADVT